MVDGYTKLFSSIIHSTVWQEPPHVKIVWVTLLAMADQHGEIKASIPGLAKAAGVDMAQCEDALNKFQSPDPYSRTKDHEGRRIEECDGGWFLLNHAKYRHMQSHEDQKAKNAARQRKFREEHKPLRNVTRNEMSRLSLQAEAEAEEKEEEKNNTPLPPKGAKPPKEKRQPQWATAYPEEVVSATAEILSFWPQSGKGHHQPNSTQDVPNTSAALLAGRLAEMAEKTADMDVCVAIARSFVSGWQEGKNWLKAAQYFFGRDEDAPFRAYYRAELTSRAMEVDSEPAV